jgi:hypothetical protein
MISVLKSSVTIAYSGMELSYDIHDTVLDLGKKLSAVNKRID